jgi:hypothetical protein
MMIRQTRCLSLVLWFVGGTPVGREPERMASYGRRGRALTPQDMIRRAHIPFGARSREGSTWPVPGCSRAWALLCAAGPASAAFNALTGRAALHRLANPYLGP